VELVLEPRDLALEALQVVVAYHRLEGAYQEGWASVLQRREPVKEETSPGLGVMHRYPQELALLQIETATSLKLQEGFH
jgi:hypothetical protein